MAEDEKQTQIHIIGAGISGLIAAKQLEKRGYSPVIIEASDRVGGRVQTELVDGYQLDLGFQVLLEAYPLAQKYLDYDKLALQPLSSGALIYNKGISQAFGDPMRDIAFFIPTVFSSLATLSDKWKIFQLKQRLEQKDLTAIFSEDERTTLAYLQSLGFSKNIIESFFRPFFSGIFLEPDLQTSSRMFEYVYKMFGAGSAMIPKAGIGQIAQQLASTLDRTTIWHNHKVKQVETGHITMENNEVIDTDFTIVATDPSQILPNYASSLEWKSCDNLYFTSPKRHINNPIIGLNKSKNALVNNIFYPTSVETEHKGLSELLSVTVVRDHSFSNEELISKVRVSLNQDFGVAELTFLKHYHLPYSLPKIDDLQYQSDETEHLIADKIALAGDHLLNGSLNAAMASGESAAEVAHQTLSNTRMKLV